MLTVLFLSRTVLLTVLVLGRRYLPASRQPIVGGVPGVTARLATASAVCATRAPVARRCRFIAAFTSRS